VRTLVGGGDDDDCDRGMQLFKTGDIDGSIELFDRALALDPSVRPYLWQRGLSLYYGK